MTQNRRARPPTWTSQMDYLDLVLHEQNERDKRQRQAPEAELGEIMFWPSCAKFLSLVQDQSRTESSPPPNR